jgi:hypothetical protein
MIIITQKWEDLPFEADLEVSAYTLNNGIRIPLPSRGKLWPKRKTKATFYRTKDDSNGKIVYRVTLVPEGKDAYWLKKWLTDQAAESALTKIGAIMIGGIIGAAAAGVATVLVPTEAAETLMWETSCSEGPVYGVTSGFNVAKLFG